MYVGEPTNYQDGEIEPLPETMTAKDLKSITYFGGLAVEEFEYKPKNFLKETFSGQFGVSGQLYYDQMWSEVGFIANDESPFTTELDADGFTFKTMHYIKFSNEEEIISALEAGQFEKLKSGEMIPVTISAKDFSIGTAYDKGSGAYQATEFIEFVD